jgi:hypothetical protein
MSRSSTTRTTLKWLTVPASLQGDADADLTWQGGDTGKSLDILVALVTMSPALTGVNSPLVKDSLNSAKVLDYTADVKVRADTSNKGPRLGARGNRAQQR